MLRFLAALGVVQSHVAARFVSAAANQTGAIGVDVFFVISGVVITLTARRHPRGFLRNRAIRVLPPYYLWAAPWLIGALAMGAVPLDTLASSATLWPIWGNRFAPPVLGQAWTLCFEMLFYVAVWLVLRGVRPIWLLLAFGAADVLAGATHLALFSFVGSPLILEFLAGVGLALATLQNRWLGAVALAAGACAVAFFAVTGAQGMETLVGGAGSLRRAVLWGGPAALIVFGALQLEPLLQGAWVRPLAFLGDASYALYLSHSLVLVLIGYAWGAAPAWFCVGACVAAGAAAYVLVERPLVNGIRAILRPRVAAPEAASA